MGAAKKRKSEADAEGAAAEKIAKLAAESETPKEVTVDLNEAPVDEDVEEVNIASSPVVDEPEDEPEVPDNIVPGVDDYDEKIDGKGLSKFLVLFS